MFTHIITVGAAATSLVTTAGQSGLRSLAIALGGSLGAVGAGVGIGLIFKGVLESVTRQPEMRSEITSPVTRPTSSRASCDAAEPISSGQPLLALASPRHTNQLVERVT